MHFKDKIYNSFDIKAIETVRKWKKEGEKIVFTNGCFDILHSGHIHYLSQASELGDIFILGLNSDASVARLKGEDRPVKSQQCRADILAFMKDIDMVVIFEEDTPENLIKQIVPDVLVKGGDWKPEEIVGADIVLENGGVVKSLSFLEGFSSTSIIKELDN